MLGQEKRVAGNMQGSVPAPDSAGRNNNFYDNTDTFRLDGGVIEVTGEIGNPGPADFSSLPLRSVIVKEALPSDDGTNRFTGAYRYDGYSLFDILQDRMLDKKNAAEFSQCIDLYIEIENDKGEKTVLSWGEVFYPVNLHNIIIATSVSRIVPSKTKELWPLPAERKLVVGTDLLTVRNLSNPVKIRVISYPRSFVVNRELSPLYSGSFQVELNGKPGPETYHLPAGSQVRTLNTIFYGKGRGIHSTTPFTGVELIEILDKGLKQDKVALQSGLVCMAGIDGYRAVFSLGEIINRNDQAQILLVPCDTLAEGGKFRILPGFDFFSDRAVKALSKIVITTELPVR